MCLAIYRPVNAQGTISTDDLDNSLEGGNSDAFGLMWPEDGKLRVWKSALRGDFGHFQDKVKSLQDRSVPLAVHMRFATHGGLDEHNAHPVEVLPGQLAIIHNGIISGVGEHTKLSDTVLFAKKLRQLPRNWYRNRELCSFLEGYLGTGNKIVVMASDGVTKVLNSGSGHWERGIWWSNHNYVASTPTDWSDWAYEQGWKHRTTKFLPALSARLGALPEAPAPPDTRVKRGSPAENEFVPLAVTLCTGEAVCFGCFETLGHPDFSRMLFWNDVGQDHCELCDQSFIEQAGDAEADTMMDNSCDEDLERLYGVSRETVAPGY